MHFTSNQVSKCGTTLATVLRTEPNVTESDTLPFGHVVSTRKLPIAKESMLRSMLCPLRILSSLHTAPTQQRFHMSTTVDMQKLTKKHMIKGFKEFTNQAVLATRKVNPPGAQLLYIKSAALHGVLC